MPLAPRQHKDRLQCDLLQRRHGCLVLPLLYLYLGPAMACRCPLPCRPWPSWSGRASICSPASTSGKALDTSPHFGRPLDAVPLPHDRHNVRGRRPQLAAGAPRPIPGSFAQCLSLAGGLRPTAMPGRPSRGLIWKCQHRTGNARCLAMPSVWMAPSERQSRSSRSSLRSRQRQRLTAAPKARPSLRWLFCRMASSLPLFCGAASTLTPVRGTARVTCVRPRHGLVTRPPPATRPRRPIHICGKASLPAPSLRCGLVAHPPICGTAGHWSLTLVRGGLFLAPFCGVALLPIPRPRHSLGALPPCPLSSHDLVTRPCGTASPSLIPGCPSSLLTHIIYKLQNKCDFLQITESTRQYIYFLECPRFL